MTVLCCACFKCVIRNKVRSLLLKVTIAYNLNVFDALVTVFTTLHGMQKRSSDENSVYLSVCLSVCPSVRLSNEWMTKRKKICPDYYIIQKII